MKYTGPNWAQARENAGYAFHEAWRAIQRGETVSFDDQVAAALVGAAPSLRALWLEGVDAAAIAAACDLLRLQLESERSGGDATVVYEAFTLSAAPDIAHALRALSARTEEGNDG